MIWSRYDWSATRRSKAVLLAATQREISNENYLIEYDTTMTPTCSVLSDPVVQSCFTKCPYILGRSGTRYRRKTVLQSIRFRLLVQGQRGRYEIPTNIFLQIDTCMVSIFNTATKWY